MAENAEVWEQDVLGREIVIHPGSLLIFRLRGHDWSVVVRRLSARARFGRAGHGEEKALSRRLHTALIIFARSDTFGSIGYTLIEDGELVEDFYGEDDGNGGLDLETCRVVSIRRDLRATEIGNPYSFVESFLGEEGAFDPGIEFGYFFGHRTEWGSESRKVENPGFTVVYRNGVVRDRPEIERIDHVIQKST
jgi:hypothetical protein